MGRRRMSVIALLVAAGGTGAAGGALAPASAATITKVPCGGALSTLRPAAGSQVQLGRGCTYHDYLTIRADNVTVTAYGSGSAPVITLNNDGATISLYGSHDTVRNLTLAGVAPRTWTCGGKATPAGHVDGVDIYPGATGDIVTNVTASGFYAGVYIMAGATGNTVQNSTLKNNIELDTNKSSGSSGAFGVLLWGNGNTIQGNNIYGNQACSLAYGRDGSAVEIYGGSHNVISGNTASNDNAITELGSYSGHTATGNSVTGNDVSDGSGKGITFFVTRGSGDSDGPVYKTTLSGNTVNLTKSGDQGVVSYDWRAGDGTLLTLTGNYLNLGSSQALYEDGGYVDGGGNTFIGTCNPSSDCR
jgi:hypothetical protein